MADGDNKAKVTESSITPAKALAYVANKLGKQPVKAIAASMGKGERTIARYIADMDAYIRQSPEYQEFIRNAPKLVGKAFRVYDTQLDSDNTDDAGVTLSAARDVLKFTGIYIDRKQDIPVPVSQLTDEELEAEIAELIAHDQSQSGGAVDGEEAAGEDGTPDEVSTDTTPE